ncbi:MAG: D-glycerate dehydrogenase [Chloroflexota bacterium]
MATVYVTRIMMEKGLAMLRDAGHDVTVWEGDMPIPRETLLDATKNADAVLPMLTEKIDAAFMDNAPNLKVISNFAVGYDNIDIPEATRRGIPVGHTPDVLTESTADTAFMLMMAAARRLPEAQQDVRDGKWHTWEPLGWLGQDIHGATLGVIGFGRIGQAVARRGSGFNMNVIYHNRSRKPDAEAEIGAAYRELDDLLQQSDFISINTPLTDETHHLIGERELAMMKSTAVIVNTARGGVIDPSALYVALRAKMIFAAGLDVTEPEPIPASSPLLTLPNCVVVPHIGSATHASREAIAVLAARNLLAGLNGERLPHCVNPEVYS